MVVKRFPPSHLADEHGLLAVGGDVELETLLLAYRSGIFPWPIRPDLLTWFAPPDRAILEIESFMVSRSLQKFLKRNEFDLAVNQDFHGVINACRDTNNRKGQKGTWITDELVSAYVELHKHGYAHSIECYDGDELVGGLYGVSIGQTFAGESMFHRRDNASKLCFCFLVAILRGAGVPWIDCQMLTPLTAGFGAREVSRDDFELFLKRQLSLPPIKIFPAKTSRIKGWKGGMVYHFEP